MMHYIEHIRNILASLGHFFDLKLCGAAMIGLYSFFFGADLKLAMLSLIALMVFDLLTGTAVAWMKGNVSSRAAVKTPFKFGIYLMLVSAAHLTDVAVFHGLYLEQTMIAFLALTELISIIENAGRAGFAIPKKLLSRLEMIRDSK